VASSLSIPLKVLPLGSQRYSCHGCGDCCRDFTVQLRDADLEKLRVQAWEAELGEVTVEFRGQRYLRQREDGGCVFLRADGKCRIHAEHGLEAKPLACQMFPFALAPDAREARIGISFACASVLANHGAGLASHLAEVRRMARDVPELGPSRTLLDASTEATPEEASAVADVLDRWLREGGLPLAVRVDGLAWLGQQLAAARFAKVRGPRLRELMDTLVDALPQELPLHPIDPATGAQRSARRPSSGWKTRRSATCGASAACARCSASTCAAVRSRRAAAPCPRWAIAGRPRSSRRWIASRRSANRRTSRRSRNSSCAGCAPPCSAAVRGEAAITAGRWWTGSRRWR
jgi:Fe-S-cluster containining protein